MTMKLWG